jgi:hypothetical protein
MEFLTDTPLASYGQENPGILAKIVAFALIALSIKIIYWVARLVGFGKDKIDAKPTDTKEDMEITGEMINGERPSDAINHINTCKDQKTWKLVCLFVIAILVLVIITSMVMSI